MKKLIFFISALTVILGLSIVVYHNALAESISGSTASEKTFYVTVNSSNAYIELTSEKGLANVIKYLLGIINTGTVKEQHHGFYHVHVYKNSYNYVGEYWWTPSATKEGTFIKNPVLRISFPSTGVYKIKVAPLSDVSDNYWKEDCLESWYRDATWSVSNTFGCTVSNYDNGTVHGGIVNLYYYIDGNYYSSETKTISSSQYISPKTISGYTCTSGSQYVSFDSSTGNCSPSTISFYYSKDAAPAPAPGGLIVMPYDWDTQFKPGTATRIYNGKVDNENRYKRLPYLYDNDASTSFYWVIWKTERTDDIPEISALFNGATVSSVGIRNGNTKSQSNYYKYARVSRFRVRIYCSIGVRETYITLNDNFTKDYQKCDLGGTYSGVTRIDFFLDGGKNEGFYTGSSETYYIHISDMQFYN